MSKSISFDTTSYSAASALISLCFEARTKTHIAHLQTEHYAEHKALNEFYDSIINLADSYAEAYQGRYGIIKSYPKAVISAKSGSKVIEILRSWIDANRQNCGSDSSLQNEIDSIVTLCNSTLYKLTLK